MTYEEMRAAVKAMLDEGEAATTSAEEILEFVPADDKIIGELFAAFEAATDDFITKRDGNKSFAEIIAAATQVRNTSLIWARYVRATVMACDRRWSENKGRDEID